MSKSPKTPIRTRSHSKGLSTDHHSSNAVPLDLNSHISGIQNTINNLKLEYQHFQKAGMKACTTEKELSTEHHEDSRKKIHKPGRARGMSKDHAHQKDFSHAENVSFDVFGENDTRNHRQDSPFALPKKHKQHERILMQKNSNNRSYEQKKYFKFDNSKDFVQGMSFGVQQKSRESYSSKKFAESPRRNLVVKKIDGKYIPLNENIPSNSIDNMYQPLDLEKLNLPDNSLTNGDTETFRSVLWKQIDSSLDKKTDETNESIHEWLKKTSNMKLSTFINNLVEENETLKSQVDSLSKDLQAKQDKYFQSEKKLNDKIIHLCSKTGQLKEGLNREREQKSKLEIKIKNFLEWLEKEHDLNVADIFYNGNKKSRYKRKKTKRVSSMVNTKNSLNDTKESQYLLDMSHHDRSESDITCKQVDPYGNIRFYRPLISPTNSISLNTSQLRIPSVQNHIEEQRNENSEVEKYLNLRKELKKESELISKLRKLLMDTSHPGCYEYQQWPKLSHVWRWVKKLVSFRLDHTENSYIS